ncbi:MAG: carboxylesterase/lipase family protein [Bacteroidales bacterium]|nr:carboxylesterase/lipase family protein [Bacteroidales bacterium]
MNKQIIFILIAVYALIASDVYAQSGPILAGENIAVTSTKYGKVRGYIDDGIYAFKGIPYAKAERFMPAQAPDKWDDVRQCTIYGPQAMQNKAQNWTGQSDDNFGFQFSREPMDEKESFVLNVWSQGLNDGKKRPVWVWLHGGGYAGGSGNQLPCFDGRSMADKGDIVVVTINHRLNVLGYTDLRGLGGKYSESVNLGMRDIVAALQWIKDNIENFGGDPGSVTISGQSGGGMKVSTLMAMPSAVGVLFHKAIVQSGAINTLESGENSKAFGLAFAAALGVNSRNADKLNDFTYEELVAAERLASGVLRAAGSEARGGAPSIDGKYITQSPFDPAPAEFAKDIPMLIGCNLNEFNYYNRALITPKTMAEVKASIAERYGAENVDKYISLYKEAYPNETEPHRMLVFDTNFRGGALSQATFKSKQGGAPVYNYLLTWQSPVNDGSLGAAHGMELSFMFNNIELARTLTGCTKEAYELEDKISSAWINFIKTGNPNAKNLPEWDAFTSETGATMIFDNECKVLYNHDKALIDFIRSFPLARLFRRR